ncbi:histidine kinase [Kitasatospora sp. NPDC093806]|uniref:sensor histidine kinase n=1 Tax=Kitasatospora sp. NPDC093806 TaxID=3155075 RepID=UPI003416DBC7
MSTDQPARPSRRPRPAALGWYAPGRNRLTETLLLGTVLVLAAEETFVQWYNTELPLRPLRIAGAALASLSLLLARRHPVAAAVLPALVSGLLNRAFPGLFSAYHLATTGRPGPALAVGAATALLSVVRAESVVAWAGTAGSQLVVAAAALSLGLWLHGRRVLIRTLHAKVDALRRERELRAEQARSTERARIAREMHDVLAHRLSLLVLHAGVLRDQARAGTVADDPERLAHRLELLRATAARSLDDLRDVLGALRADPSEYGTGTGTGGEAVGGAADSDGPSATLLDGATAADPVSAPGPLLVPPAAPGGDRPDPVAAPALRDLAELVGEATDAGQIVELALAGDPESIPTTHRLAVHRVVQEALTNARKYAHTAPVTVRVRYGAPATTVEVHNGPGDPAPAGACTGGGYGLVGLGERVGALGGHFDAGPDGRGGFRLAARLPAPQRPPVRAPDRAPDRPPTRRPARRSEHRPEHQPADQSEYQPESSAPAAVRWPGPIPPSEAT